MDPIALILVILALVCGGYAVFRADARAAGCGVLALALLAILAGRG